MLKWGLGCGLVELDRKGQADHRSLYFKSFHLHDVDSDSTEVIMGGPLTSEKLMMLPRKWEKLTLWGVYVHLITPHKNSASRENGTGRYRGPAIGRDGLEGRLAYYARLNAGNFRSGTKNAPKAILHDKWLQCSTAALNLRVVAIFNQVKIAKLYIMLLELLVSILLQTLPKTATGIYINQPAINIVIRATPKDLYQELPTITYEPLNKAAKCLRAIRHKACKFDHNCNNYGRSINNLQGEKVQISADPGILFTR